MFETWLRAAYPELGADPGKATAATVLGRDRKMHFELGPDGNFRHRVNESTGTIWTRDSAVMTPRGLLICRSASVRRRPENIRPAGP